jgi:hypothetical protein
MPARLQKHGAELLHFQCWLWGCDIRRAEGNLLLEYGFSRQRPPVGAAGSSAYLLSLAPDAVLVLWGFGAFCGDPGTGGVYLKRYEFTPVFVAHLNAHRLPWLPDQLRPVALPAEPGARQRMHRQFVTLIEWIAQYERWVRDSCGLAYRRQCAAESTRHTFRIPVERLVEEWQQLAHQSASLS